MTSAVHYRVVVVGTSSGGLNALSEILARLRPDLSLSIIVVQHMGAHAGDYLVRHLDRLCPLPVHEALDKEDICPGHVYLAPPNYHLMVEKEGTLALSLEGRVNFARPSIDVTFETAVEAFGPNLVGIVLTGANADGSRGLKRIRECGGLTVVQNPDTAEAAEMPRAAIAGAGPDHILNLGAIADFINSLS